MPRKIKVPVGFYPPEPNLTSKKDDKVWLSYEDIVRLYGPIARKRLDTIRKSRQVTYAKHPFNAKVYIYLKEDVEKMIENTVIPKKHESILD